MPWAPGLKVTIDVAHRNTVSARWFDIWAGAVSVTAVCTAMRYAGISGSPTGLSVTLEAVISPRVENEIASAKEKT